MAHAWCVLDDATAIDAAGVHPLDEMRRRHVTCGAKLERLTSAGSLAALLAAHDEDVDDWIDRVAAAEQVAARIEMPAKSDFPSVAANCARGVPACDGRET